MDRAHSDVSKTSGSSAVRTSAVASDGTTIPHTFRKFAQVQGTRHGAISRRRYWPSSIEPHGGGRWKCEVFLRKAYTFLGPGKLQPKRKLPR